jgi:hypothetical protein
MAVQPNTGPGLPFWGFVTITFLRGWIVSPTPNPEPGGPGLRIYDPGDRVAQLNPQALGTHFSRLLRHAWVAVGLLFTPGHHTGESINDSMSLIELMRDSTECVSPCSEMYYNL